MNVEHEDRCPVCRKVIHWNDKPNIHSLDVFGRCLACDEEWRAKPFFRDDEGEEEE